MFSLGRDYAFLCLNALSGSHWAGIFVSCHDFTFLLAVPSHPWMMLFIFFLFFRNESSKDPTVAQLIKQASTTKDAHECLLSSMPWLWQCSDPFSHWSGRSFNLMLWWSNEGLKWNSWIFDGLNSIFTSLYVSFTCNTALSFLLLMAFSSSFF